MTPDIHLQKMPNHLSKPKENGMLKILYLQECLPSFTKFIFVRVAIEILIAFL